MGVPEPGSVADIEDTRKQPDPTQMASPESASQVTLGGANYFVEGAVLKIDGQHYTVRRDESGEQVKLIVNQDTNLDCAGATASEAPKKEALTSERIPAEKQAPQASPRQLEQGQRKDETARGAGFRIGQCDFRPGDRVKAEVDDNGRVTTLKYLAGLTPKSPRAIGESAGTGTLAIPQGQEKPGQLDMSGAGGSMPTDYAILPIPVGGFKTSGGNLLLYKPVQDLQGKKVGTLESLITDSHSGRVEYAVVAIEHGMHLHPVPWSAVHLKSSGKGGGLTPVIDTSKFRLMPELTMDDSKDLSPNIKSIVKNMEALRDREAKKAGKRHVPGEEQRSTQGPHGEDQTGSGMSGFRDVPPGKAPSFEEEGKKKD